MNGLCRWRVLNQFKQVITEDNRSLTHPNIFTEHKGRFIGHGDTTFFKVSHEILKSINQALTIGLHRLFEYVRI